MYAFVFVRVHACVCMCFRASEMNLMSFQQSMHFISSS